MEPRRHERPMPAGLGFLSCHRHEFLKTPREETPGCPCHMHFAIWFWIFLLSYCYKKEYIIPYTLHPFVRENHGIYGRSLRLQEGSRRDAAVSVPAFWGTSPLWASPVSRIHTGGRVWWPGWCMSYKVVGLQRNHRLGEPIQNVYTYVHIQICDKTELIWNK